MPNENCLKGKRCPKCGQSEAFRVVATVVVTLSDSGVDDTDDFEFEDNSHALCNDCEYEGKWSEFTEKEKA